MPNDNEQKSDERNKRQTIDELVAGMDISNIGVNDIVVDLIAGIQQLAIRGTIALKLLERIPPEGTTDEKPIE
jgi:hypothetical protein